MISFVTIESDHVRNLNFFFLSKEAIFPNLSFFWFVIRNSRPIRVYILWHYDTNIYCKLFIQLNILFQWKRDFSFQTVEGLFQKSLVLDSFIRFLCCAYHFVSTAYTIPSYWKKSHFRCLKSMQINICIYILPLFIFSHFSQYSLTIFQYDLFSLEFKTYLRYGNMIR